MTQNPTTNTEAGAVADVAAKLTEAQRAAVMLCRHKASGPGGQRWDFVMLRAATRKALVKTGIASPWGMVSASLTPLGLAVRQHLEQGATAS